MFVIGAGLFLVTILAALFGPLVYNVTMETVGVQYAPPGAGYLLGLDNLGRDYVSLLLVGLRSSLYVGLIAGVIATTIGTLIGIYGGFKGGWVDDILNMLTNLFVVIPQFVILILISSSLEKRSLLLVAGVIGLTTWTWTARSVRAQSSALKSKDHISLPSSTATTRCACFWCTSCRTFFRTCSWCSSCRWRRGFFRSPPFR